MDGAAGSASNEHQTERGVPPDRFVRSTRRPDPQQTRTHNAATNCYRFNPTKAGNLWCQLPATGVNFLAAGGSALVILGGKYMKCRAGGMPRCVVAVRLDGPMTLMHVCASTRSRPRCPSRFAWAKHPALTAPRLSASFPRPWAYRTPVRASPGPQFACPDSRLFVAEHSCPMRAPLGRGEST